MCMCDRLCRRLRTWTRYYFTLSFLPARMLLPFIPLSCCSFFTVVWFFLAISDNDCPGLIVTLFALLDLPLILSYFLYVFLLTLYDVTRLL